MDHIEAFHRLVDATDLWLIGVTIAIAFAAIYLAYAWLSLIATRRVLPGLGIGALIEKRPLAAGQVRSEAGVLRNKAYTDYCRLLQNTLLCPVAAPALFNEGERAMTVIAMTREMGSLGRDVALRLAEDLGLELVQHQMVEHVADKMHLQESSVNRFLEGKAGLLERWGIDEKALSQYTHEEILDVAAKDNVLIRGWGATYVLRNIPHVLCVRVCSSEESRIDVLMKRIGLTDRDVARKEIRANDAAHARTMSHLFHVENWGDPLLFDVVLNTEQLSVATCVSTVKAILQQPLFIANPASESMLDDMRIEARIQAALRANAVTAQSNPSFEFELEPGTGRVVLSGVVFDDEFANTAEQLIADVPGVSEVDNQTQILRHTIIGP